MKLFKRKELESDISVIQFYTMLRWYDRKSSNIAVVKDKRKFKNIVKHFKKEIDPRKEDRVMKINDDKYLFIINDTDIAIALIEKIDDLDSIKMNFGKFV